MAESKPIHVKPSMYAYFFSGLKEIALQFGYNLVMHGSMNRDFDLIAIPWIDEPKPELEMIQAFDLYLTGIYHSGEGVYMFSILPGGRKSYVINLNRGGKWNNYLDEQYYIDISVTPRTSNSEHLLNIPCVMPTVCDRCRPSLALHIKPGECIICSREVKHTEA